MVALAGYGMPLSTIANAAVQQNSAEIRGVIVGADGLTAVAGVTVKAANLETSQVFESARTGSDGAYDIAALPAGPYELAVETSAGRLYATDTTVQAGAGKRTMVSLSLRPDNQEGQPEKPKEEPPKTDEGKPEQPKPDQPAEPAPDTAAKKKGTSFWRSKTGASILIVGGAIVLGFGASALSSDNDDDDDDDSMSPGGGTGNTPN
jgi:hypothetical protein